MNQKTFLIIDGHALIYRAYHAFPPVFINKEGILVNAVYGFARVLLAGMREFKPEFIALTFDSKEKTERQREFPYYKANRPPMPDDLIPQIELIKQFVEAMNIPQYAIPGEEADDIIGSMAGQLAKTNCDGRPCAEGEMGDILTVVMTGDRDTFQLVNTNIHVYLPKKGKDEPEEIDAEGVKTRMGVWPKQIVDYKALAGDPSDNIKGVSGVGAKTAVKLLTAFGSLDGVYAAIDAGPEKYPEILKGVLLKNLIADRKIAYDSQKLATIIVDDHIAFNLDDCKVKNYNKEKAVKLLEEFDFPSLIRMLPQDRFETEVQEMLF